MKSLVSIAFTISGLVAGPIPALAFNGCPGTLSPCNGRCVAFPGPGCGPVTKLEALDTADVADCRATGCGEGESCQALTDDNYVCFSDDLPCSIASNPSCVKECMKHLACELCDIQCGG